MGVLKNDVGRPSNKTIKIRRLLKATLAISLICIIYILGNFNSNKLKGLTTDIQAPSLSYFNVASIKAIAGESISVATDIKDDISGIASFRVYYVDFENPEEHGFLNQFAANIFDGVMYIPNNVKPGTYTLTMIEASDVQGNTKKIDTSGNCDKNSTSQQRKEEFCFDNIQIQNKSLEILPSNNDVEVPVLEEISIDKTAVNIGEALTISAKAKDEGSGIGKITVSISSTLDGAGDIARLYYDVSTGSYKGSYVVKNSGDVLYITDVTLYDLNENSIVYINKNLVSKTSNPTFALENILILNGVEDKEKPLLIDYSFANDKVDVPYNLPISLTVSDDVGVRYAYVFAKNKELIKSSSKEVYAYFECENKSGKQECNSKMELNQYLEKGEYIVNRIEIVDNAGKATIYDIDPYGDELKLENSKKFEIISAFSYDLTISTNSNNSVDLIKQVPDNSNIAVDSSINTIVKKEIFSAIKGTNKKLYIEKNGITWIFDGKDIITPKDVNVDVSFNYLHMDGLSEQLSEHFDKALVINFADNGDLPGKALIRVKADYALSEYLGNSLYVMYYDVNNGMFDLVAKEISVSDTGYYEFYISHNSSYVISNNKPEEENITDNKEDLEINNNIKKDNINNDTNKSNNRMIILVVMGVVIVITIIVIVNKLKKNKKKQIRNNLKR